MVGTTRPPPRVRPFEEEDRDAVLGLAARLVVGIAPWRSPGGMLAAARRWVAESIAAIGNDAAVIVAVDAEERPLGFVSIARQEHFTGEEHAYVGELAVADGCEDRGIGRALMAAAERWTADRGLDLIVLETGAANRRARGFYARLGYEEESVRLAKAIG